MKVYEWTRLTLELMNLKLFLILRGREILPLIANNPGLGLLLEQLPRPCHINISLGQFKLVILGTNVQKKQKNLG